MSANFDFLQGQAPYQLFAPDDSIIKQKDSEIQKLLAQIAKMSEEYTAQ